MTEIFTIEVELEKPLTISQRAYLFERLKAAASVFGRPAEIPVLGPDVDPVEQAMGMREEEA